MATGIIHRTRVHRELASGKLSLARLHIVHHQSSRLRLHKIRRAAVRIAERRRHSIISLWHSDRKEKRLVTGHSAAGHVIHRSPKIKTKPLLLRKTVGQLGLTDKIKFGFRSTRIANSGKKCGPENERRYSEVGFICRGF